MNILKITLCFVLVAITGIHAQEKENAFLLGPENVKVYSFDTSTKGSQLEYEFEDDYSVKLTNKVYKIKLLFEETKREAVQRTISKILDGDDASLGYEKMLWKKTADEGKPMYEVELKDNILRIKVFRKQMNAEAYNTLNILGQEFIKEIKERI